MYVSSKLPFPHCPALHSVQAVALPMQKDMFFSVSSVCMWHTLSQCYESRLCNASLLCYLVGLYVISLNSAAAVWICVMSVCVTVVRAACARLLCVVGLCQLTCACGCCVGVCQLTCVWLAVCCGLASLCQLAALSLALALGWLCCRPSALESLGNALCPLTALGPLRSSPADW